MSTWLEDGEVLVGQGSGEASPMCTRQRGPMASPRLGPTRGRSLVTSPNREATPGTPQPETMGKARELFMLCDKEGKGFITKRDMQRLQGELPLSPEQLETVFESLDLSGNGFLTPIEFNTGLGELMGLDETPKNGKVEPEEDKELFEWTQDPNAVKFMKILMELDADKLFKDQWELCSNWCELQRDRPELMSILEAILAHAVSHVQDSIRERDSLEQALRRREAEHDQVVRSIYEEMESEVREEREKRLTEDTIRHRDRGQQLQEVLKTQEQELQVMLADQRELESRIQLLNTEQADIKEQNQRLQSVNRELQDQLESSRERLHAAQAQLGLIQLGAAEEQMAKQRNVMKVSRNMQKEKDSLLRQLELLRDMNKQMRDAKDAHQSQKRTTNDTKPLQKQGSVIGNYLLQDKPMKRQLSSVSYLEQDSEETPHSSKRYQASGTGRCENVEQTQTETPLVSPQRAFKVVFLGNSGVGKTSFIQHCCKGHFSKQRNATVGIDFQMKSVTLGSATVVLQLWDTAGQERFRSITQQYYRKADGIIIMYDITQSASFIAVREWLDIVQERKGKDAVLMLLGNKLDVTERQPREVTTRDGQRLADHYEAVFYECSAKSGYNMDEPITRLAGLLAALQDQQCEDTLSLSVHPTKTGCCT